MSPRLALTLAFLAGCGPGPTVYLGRAPIRDAGADSGISPDASDVDDAGDEHDNGDDPDRDDDDDDDLIPCADDSFCDDGTPLCDPKWSVCVECHEDDDCDRNEHCTRGSCRDD